MKKIISVMMALAACVALAAMPRSEWHAKVSEAAQDAKVMKATIARLSPADQVAFLAEVNEAIAAMPGSPDAKAAAYLAANRAAVAGATKEARLNVLAEVFATVPTEVLTVINEDFAKTLFDRNGDPSRTFTDAEFQAIAETAMKTIDERCETVENSEIRETFAALLFVRASGGTPTDLADTLVHMMPNVSMRDTARNEWMKAALGEGGTSSSYDSMLGAAQAGDEPNHAIVVTVAPAQANEALMGEFKPEVPSGLKVEEKAPPGHTDPLTPGSGASLLEQAFDSVPQEAIQNPDVDGGKYYQPKRDGDSGSGGTIGGGESGGGGGGGGGHRGYPNEVT